MDARTLPAARLLSNGRYTVCLTARGAGFSSLGPIALSERHEGRWDLRGGLQLLLRDLERGGIWPAGTGADAPETDYMAAWTAGSAQLAGTREGIATQLELLVHPDLDLECRRLRVRNLGQERRRLELTAYLEPVLLPAAAHEAHPAFSKLFLQTQWLEAAGALVVRRRRRDPGQGPPPLILAMPGAAALAWESARSRLLPRGTSRQQARWAPALATFRGSVGSVLDPALALRRELLLAGGESVELLVLAGAMHDEQALLAQFRELAAPGRFDSVLEGARTSQLHMLAELGLRGEDAAYFELLAAGLLLDHPALLAGAPAAGNPAARAAARARLGLAPDRRFLLADDERLTPAALDRLCRGQLYWQALALPLDLAVVAAAATPGPDPGLNGCRRLRREDWSPAELAALAAAAVFCPQAQLPALRAERGEAPVGLAPAAMPAPAVPAAGRPSSLRFFNGHGGFGEDGREYQIRLPYRNGRLVLPPQPWVNVIASEGFGFLVSETGAGTTWRGNSREHRLTPWANDPILDPHGEAFYLRDEESGAFWSPLPGPAPAPADYTMAHGLGYSRCTLVHDGLALETLLFAAAADPLRLTRIQVRNLGRSARRLSFWAHYRLSLGVPAGDEGREICTEPGPAAGDLQARRAGAATPIAFAAARAAGAAAGAVGSGDRGDFLGPALDPAAPAALADGKLPARTGAGLDPAFTQRLRIELAPGELAELCFLFGEADSEAEVATLCRRYDSAEAWRAAFAAQREVWADLCDRLQVSTPEPALDLMVNAWLPYQTLSCRLHGRSAFYQSGGAFGFRDQLQDAGALLAHDPQLTRRQILLHAAHQFDAGDVMHWWHPLVEIGLRTRFADDLLWLPLLTAEYLAATGDEALLAERVDFLRGRPLAADEEEALLPIEGAEQPADLYAHCCRAIDRSLGTGAHGLPLFGGGDWNDGMNRVGREGRGESVWMGFFLVSVIDAFLPLVAARADAERRQRYAAHRGALVAALETAGWDGEWYRRGYYDDGTPLGSRENDGVPHRRPRAGLVRALGRRGPRARAPRAGGGGGSARGRAGRADSPARAALRPHAAGSRLHQGLPARRPGERRPVHACRALAGARRCRAGPARSRRSTAGAAQSDSPRRHARGDRALPSGALRRRRGRLRRRAARGPRRLDLVHGLLGLDAARRAGVLAGSAPRGRPLAAPRALHPRRVARLHDPLSSRGRCGGHALSPRGRQPRSLRGARRRLQPRRPAPRARGGDLPHPPGHGRPGAR